MNLNYKFTYITTFAGCGGSSTGYEMAGGKGLLAVEFNENAVKNYHINHQETPIYYGDIHNLTEEKIKKLIPGFKPGTIDILDGSPPCQGFSQNGKCNPNDLRNRLYEEYIRILGIVQPKVSIIENVKALTFKRNKPILEDMLQKLQNTGYTPRLKIMNAKYYNCATSRERTIIISTRNDLNIVPTFPEPNTNLVSIQSVLKNIKPDKIRLASPRLKKFLKKVKPGESISKVHPKGHYFNSYLLNPSGQSPTILKGSGQGLFLAYRGTYRHLAPNELAIIQSFPPDYKWYGSWTDKINRIGNSVPPMLMKAIAEHVYETILKQ